MESGSVGIGTSSPQSTLSVSGGMAIGSTYAGADAAAPSNLIVEGSVGIGTSSPQSTLSVSGGMAIGSSYAGTDAAATSNLIVEGSVGIGTSTPQEKLDIKGGNLIVEGSITSNSMKLGDWTISADGENLKFEYGDDKSFSYILINDKKVFHEDTAVNASYELDLDGHQAEFQPIIRLGDLEDI